MKTINLNCVFGALAPGINEVESEVAEQLIAAGYATLSDASGGVETVTREAFDALVAERDALVAERDALVAELGMAQAELVEANSGKTSKAK